MISFVWVTTDDFEAFETAVNEDPSVESYTLLTESNDEQLYRMEWVSDAELVVHILIKKDSTITSAETTGES